MPKRTDIHKILIIGSGPIQIGQGCEFDYSGTQACKALKDEGYEVILINSNPATIMTDPESADQVYIEPISYEFVIKVIEKEKPDAILPTMGGQAALNILDQLHQKGDLKKYNLKSIGVSPETIEIAEDREKFKALVDRLGYKTPKGDFVRSKSEALQMLDKLNVSFPVIIRAAYTLGGTGGGIAYDREEYVRLVEKGLDASPIHELQIEESILGWKEYELEVMQDPNKNFVVVCSVENVNPVGVHTGDSITIAPSMTLTDKEYQKLRDIAKDIFAEIGMESGGANIQFAVHPDTGEIIVIEMNPRVSRSSALVSKATGYPIARISAKIAAGYNLDELTNEITGHTPAAFEPVIDYIAIKIPRWDFAKFPESNDGLGIQMKSVGEVLAFGRGFKDAFQKAWRSLENGSIGWTGLDTQGKNIREILKQPTAELFNWIKTALEEKISIDEIYSLTKISKWFLKQLEEIVSFEQQLIKDELTAENLREAKKMGLSNKQLAVLLNRSETDIEKLLTDWQIHPTFKMVDTCSAEFEAKTPYYFKTYEQHNDNRISDREKIIIIGSGPNRIGQGIEFDYSCVHAVKAFQEAGYEAILVNCNPETVSTDYNTSDKLYVEPLTREDVLAILNQEKPKGVVIQFGGQTPLKLAKDIEEAGFKILGTDFSSIELAENREEFGRLLDELKIKAAPYDTVFDAKKAVQVAKQIGYPVLVRPSYVIGGQGMKIVYSDDDMIKYIKIATQLSPEHPILIDKFLEDAYEFDLDAISDGNQTFIGGIMQHIEEAGIHSGDSSCVMPPFRLSTRIRSQMIEQTNQICKRLNINGLINIQFAIYKKELYILEVNPRSSRTVPFVSKASGIPLAKYAALLCLGTRLDTFGLTENTIPKTIAVKVPVFPFAKFDKVNTFLGPEMRSIGEVMGRSLKFGNAFAKALIASGKKIPTEGAVLITVNDEDKFKVLPIVRDIYELGFEIIATIGTGRELITNGIPTRIVRKVSDPGDDVSTVDLIEDGTVKFIINTPVGDQARKDETAIGQASIKHNVPFLTTLTAAHAFTRAIMANLYDSFEVNSLN